MKIVCCQLLHLSHLHVSKFELAKLNISIPCILLCRDALVCPSSDALRVCFERRGAESSLYTSAVQFLCVLFTEEAKRRSVGRVETRREPGSSLTEVLSSEPGELVCELLLEVTQTGV